MSDKTSAMLPCPFCGSEPALKQGGDIRRSKRAMACIMPLCAVMPETAWFPSSEDAERAWNTRA